MNDNELSTMVRESVADIHSATPVAQIISRGRAVRARRRIPAVAGALAVAAGTALAVTMLLPFGHPAPMTPTIRGCFRLAIRAAIPPACGWPPGR